MTKQPDFSWPEGIKAAVSLTFDDARFSQLDAGIPVLDKYNVKATFYVSPDRLRERVPGWRKAAANGHEIGNHSFTHPCTGNFGFSRDNALEDKTLAMMQDEIDRANALIKDLLGVETHAYAYPCGQKYVGRGKNLKSYIPLIAENFLTGRGWLDEMPNDPAYCDLAQLLGMEMDGKDFSQIKVLIDRAVEGGSWLVLGGHEAGKRAFQVVDTDMLAELCAYANNPENGIWIGTVTEIARYIEKQRTKGVEGKDGYRSSQLPVDVRVKDLLSRMTLKEKVGQMNIPCVYKKRIGWGIEVGEISIHTKMTPEERETQQEGARKFTAGTHNDQIGPGGGFFTLSDRIVYEGTRGQAEFLNELQKIAMDDSRLGIPLLQIEEGTHGLMCAGGTIFPEGLALGSTWNLGLIKEVYEAAAREARAIGVHTLCTLVIEPNRDPRLGRNEEGYGEDPYLCARIAETIVSAAQGFDVSRPDKVIAALCHYPGQSEPLGGLERGAVNISERYFRDVFLPPWTAGIKKSGALAVMATYPAIAGIAVHSSGEILQELLREELRFKGIVLSEGRGISTLIDERLVDSQKEAGQIAVKSGVDVGISLEDAYLGPLVESVEEGMVSMADIDRAVGNILRVKFMLGLFENPYVDVERAVSLVHSDEHRQLALQAAREGIVLLKNENSLLPLDKNIKSIAVIGPNADADIDQLGDYSPMHIIQDIVSVLDGVRDKVSARTKVTYSKGCNVIGDKLNEIESARQAAAGADVAIVVIGEGRNTDGEGRDVADLDLTGLQEDLIRAVQSTGTPVVAVLINGRPLSIRWTAENVPAVVEAWNCGENGGHAVADVLFGDYNPSGKLPVTVPRHVGQLPMYYNYPPARAGKRYVNMSGEPLYEFGFGLSYTKFSYSGLRIDNPVINSGGSVNVSVDIENTGSRAGAEVVQLYINDVLSSVSTPVRELKGFEKVSLKPGEKKTVSFVLFPEDIALLDRNMKTAVEPGEFEVMVGSSSKDIRLSGKFEVRN